MQQILLLFAISLFIFVFRVKRIGIISLYSLFGLQWFYYWACTYGISIGFMPPNIFAGYPLHHDPEVLSMFFIFNAISLIAFSIVYLFGYKQRYAAGGYLSDDVLAPFRKYRQPLFWSLLLLNLVILITTIKIPYLKADWLAHSFAANLRNIFTGGFILYMLIEKKKILPMLLFLLFAFSTFLYGGRMYFLVLSAAYVAFLYHSKTIKMKHLVVAVTILLVILTATGLYRSRLLFRLTSTPSYLFLPIFSDSIFSAYPALVITDKWMTGSIQYYTYYTHYIVDSIMIYVPNILYASSGLAKADESGILSAWEGRHGGFNAISPQGGYHYLAEAIIAGGAIGVLVISMLFACIFIFFEKKNKQGVMGQYLYYCFLSVAGVDMVSEKFAWCFRYFSQNVLSGLLFLFIFQVLWIGAKNLKVKRIELKGSGNQ